jgi:hypothetical protein
MVRYLFLRRLVLFVLEGLSATLLHSIIKIKNLHQTFEKYADAMHSVAWVKKEY